MPQTQNSGKARRRTAAGAQSPMEWLAGSAFSRRLQPGLRVACGALALARQSTRPWLFGSAVVVIEILRGIPMVTLCRRLKHSWFLLTFSSSSMHRLLESPGLETVPPKELRAQAGHRNRIKHMCAARSMVRSSVSRAQGVSLRTLSHRIGPSDIVHLHHIDRQGAGLAAGQRQGLGQTISGWATANSPNRCRLQQGQPKCGWI
jgi:hypothetical protein